MRPWPCIPVGLLAFLPLVHSAQVPLHHQAPTIQSTTLLDAIYNDTDYLSLIKLLQRAKLIPTLRGLNGSTFFAPTNVAIEQHSRSNMLWRQALDDNAAELQDNLQIRLRQQLFYHLLNYTLPNIPTGQTPKQLPTLLYPRDSSEPPSQDPPPYPPWMPVPNGTLGTDPQRLRVWAREDALSVGVDMYGKGGVKIVKDSVAAANGVLFGIDKVLEMPPDLSTVISRRGDLSYFHKILTPEISNFLNSTPTLTLFLPVNDAWEALEPLERLYLESEFATDDLTRILNMHAVLLEEKEVKWSDSFKKPVHLPTIHGRSLKIVPADGKVKVSEGELIERDIYASNGVLHTVSDLLLPPGALQLTPEKYLLALNCTEFVSLIHSVNLTHLINDTEASYTILAPRDDVIRLFAPDDLPHRGSEELKRFLQYHFLPGKWAPKKFDNGMLVETALEEPGLAGGRQVMMVEVDDSKKDQVKAIRFAGAGVLGQEEVNNTVIYFVSRPLVPPSDALETALPDLDFSYFITGIFSTNLADTLKSMPQTTLLIPLNDAFTRLGMLVTDHLRSSSAKADFERVIRHHVLASVEYADPFVNGSQLTFRTLEGSDVHVERRGSNRTVVLAASGGWADMQSALTPRNLLTQTGVIHEVSDIMIPRSVDITVGKLVKAAKGSTMTTMVVKAGLDWVLNGTAPPEGSPWAEKGLSGSGWTLLCPTDDAFKDVNLTELYSDEKRLRTTVEQHLIPSKASSSIPTESWAVIDSLVNNRPLPLDDSTTYTTLHSLESVYGDLLVRVLGGKDGQGGTVIGIKGARGKDGEQEWAQVTSWGRSTTGGGTGGVIQIDRLLSPYQPSWWTEYGAPVSVGGGGVVLIGLFFLGVRWVWRRDTTEATYEPVGGFGPDDGES